MTIFCFDIDGTICTNTNGKYDNAKVFPDMLARVNRLYDLGHTIIFMTARGSVTKVDRTEYTKKQLAAWGFKYHKLLTNHKPHADIFIDDRGANINEWRTAGKRVGFVASSFDLIHPGYITMLKEAKTVCEHLICGLHTDPTIDRSQKNKPVQTTEERLMVLEAIKYVDEVVFYDTEDGLRNLLKTLQPDVRILGTDYRDKQVTGSELDIEIHWHERNHEWSTSGLRKRVWEAEQSKLGKDRNMAIDLDSYTEHNNYYITRKLEAARAEHETLTRNKVQYNSDNPLGLTIDNISEEVKIGVDIGTGYGWGANFLAQQFDHVYGIEPSEAALKLGKEIYKNVDNITWIHGFAEEQLQKISLEAPALFYCACVLSHLHHETAEAICSAIDQIAPPGSVICFSENWGPMHAAHCWYSRTKDWWEGRFPGWDLTFRVGGNPQARTNKAIIGVKK